MGVCAAGRGQCVVRMSTHRTSNIYVKALIKAHL